MFFDSSIGFVCPLSKLPRENLALAFTPCVSTSYLFFREHRQKEVRERCKPSQSLRLTNRVTNEPVVSRRIELATELFDELRFELADPFDHCKA